MVVRFGGNGDITSAPVYDSPQSWVPKPLRVNKPPRSAFLQNLQNYDDTSETNPLDLPSYHRKPVYKQYYKVTLYDGGKQNGDVPGFFDFTEPWNARFVKQSGPPKGANLQYQQNVPSDQQVVIEASTFLPWQKPITLRPLDVVVRFDGGVQNGDISDTPPQTEPHFTGQKLQQTKPHFNYLFSSIVPDPPATVVPSQDSPHWRKPVLFKPLDLTVRFDSTVGYPDPTSPPTPTADTPPTWFPRPLQQSYRAFPGRYTLWSIPNDSWDDSPAQFTVFWEYATQYEKKARIAHRFLINKNDFNGQSIIEESTHPGFVNKVTQVRKPNPAIITALFLNNEAQDFNPTPEGSTVPPFVNRQTQPGRYSVYTGLRFQQFAETETINVAEVNPSNIGKYTPAKHVINRGMYSFTERDESIPPEEAPATWDHRITYPQVRYRPTVHTLVRGINFGYPETSTTVFANAFRLDISTLSGLNLNYVDTALQETGTSIQLEWEQGGVNQDMQLLGYAVRGVPAETARLESSNSQGGEFILDVSTLETPTHYSQHTALNERGRSIQLEWIQNVNEQDMQILGYAIQGVVGEGMSQEQS